MMSRCAVAVEDEREPLDCRWQLEWNAQRSALVLVTCFPDVHQPSEHPEAPRYFGVFRAFEAARDALERLRTRAVKRRAGRRRVDLPHCAIVKVGRACSRSRMLRIRLHR